MSMLFIDNKIIVDHSKLAPVRPAISVNNLAGTTSKDSTKPIYYWCQDTAIGLELFIVLYTRKCGWARCTFCSLPSTSSPVEINPKHLIKQIKHVINLIPKEKLNKIVRVFISNNGSVLDANTLPTHILDEICQLAHSSCQRLQIICLETRMDYVHKLDLMHYTRAFKAWHDLAILKCQRLADTPTQLAISIGYETQDPFIRNKLLCKGYPEDKFQNMIKLFADINREMDAHISCDEYVLLKPAPGISNDEAIDECVETIRHLSLLSNHFSVPISIRLNPTFVAEGSFLHKEFVKGNYKPPSLNDVFSVLKRCHSMGVNLPIFVGINEESLSVAHGLFYEGDIPDLLYCLIIRLFNSDQNYDKLESRIKFISKTRASLRKTPQLVKLLCINKFLYDYLGDIFEMSPACIEQLNGSSILSQENVSEYTKGFDAVYTIVEELLGQ